MLFKNPRDKLQILTLAKQVYPGQTDFFLNQYEEAVTEKTFWLSADLSENYYPTSYPVKKEEGFKKIFLKSL